jgi:hypothetical protein
MTVCRFRQEARLPSGRLALQRIKRPVQHFGARNIAHVGCIVEAFLLRRGTLQI